MAHVNQGKDPVIEEPTVQSLIFQLQGTYFLDIAVHLVWDWYFSCLQERPLNMQILLVYPYAGTLLSFRSQNQNENANDNANNMHNNTKTR